MIRAALAEDIPSIVAIKKKMFIEMNMEDTLHTDFTEKVKALYKEWYVDGKALHFVVEENKEIIACAGGFIKEDIPYCFFQEDKYGFIGDVYVQPSFRRKGYAGLLTKSVMQWFMQEELQTIRLLASPSAKHLYESLGFKITDEMVLTLKNNK